jgi:hypothetical protein
MLVSCLSNELAWFQASNRWSVDDHCPGWLFHRFFIAIDLYEDTGLNDHIGLYDHNGVDANGTDWHGGPSC